MHRHKNTSNIANGTAAATDNRGCEKGKESARFESPPHEAVFFFLQVFSFLGGRALSVIKCTTQLQGYFSESRVKEHRSIDGGRMLQVRTQPTT
jgi:hypothetical protein